jgi:hypothetical protein
VGNVDRDGIKQFSPYWLMPRSLFLILIFGITQGFRCRDGPKALTRP